MRPTTSRLRGALLAGAFALGLAGPAAATNFTWATANDILGLDPHANNHGVTNAMKSNIYEICGASYS